MLAAPGGQDLMRLTSFTPCNVQGGGRVASNYRTSTDAAHHTPRVCTLKLQFLRSLLSGPKQKHTAMASFDDDDDNWGLWEGRSSSHDHQQEDDLGQQESSGEEKEQQPNTPEYYDTWGRWRGQPQACDIARQKEFPWRQQRSTDYPCAMAPACKKMPSRTRSRSVARDCGALEQLQREGWDVPHAYVVARHSPWPYVLRKMVKRMAHKLRTEGMDRALFACGAIWGSHMHHRDPGPAEYGWRDVETWLAERNFSESLRQKSALCALWDDDRLWPIDLRIGKLLNPGLRLPERPPADSEEEMWRYYPLHHAPPNNHGVGHKSTPCWGPGWQLQYHGTDVYGASHAMCCGELFPSEKETPGSGTACGRGVYTTETFKTAVRYGTVHHFPGDPREQGAHRWVNRFVLLVAIPVHAEGNVLPVATWTQDGHGKYRCTPEDERVNKVAMRTQGNKVRAREMDWSTEVVGYDQWTSSRGYVMGLCAGLMTSIRASRYGQEGKTKRMTWGYVQDFETPYARPTRASPTASVEGPGRPPVAAGSLP